METANPTIEAAYRPNATTFRAALYALLLAFIPHERNNPTRKWVTTVLFVTWGFITAIRYLHISVVPASPDAQQIYWAMTVLVFSIVSHLWGFEYGVLSSVTDSALGNDDSQSGDSDSEDDE